VVRLALRDASNGQLHASVGSSLANVRIRSLQAVRGSHTRQSIFARFEVRAVPVHMALDPTVVRPCWQLGVKSRAVRIGIAKTVQAQRGCYVAAASNGAIIVVGTIQVHGLHQHVAPVGSTDGLDAWSSEG
jgi:hypothetical protein